MSLIKDLFPPLDDAIKLEPEDLAAPLLECLCRIEDDKTTQKPNREIVTSYNYFKDYCDQNRSDEAEKIICEAWAYLENAGCITRKTGLGEWYFVTRRGRKLRMQANFKKYFSSKLLGHDNLDPKLASKVTPPFIRGDYDSAVFEAFKEVEIRVRQLSGFGKEDIGVILMRKAFKPENGPLIDNEQAKAEQQGICDLFAGAIASFKNPSSHRDADLTDTYEVVQLIMLADHLIRIAERRKKN